MDEDRMVDLILLTDVTKDPSTRHLVLVHFLFLGPCLDDRTGAINDPTFLQKVLSRLGFHWDGREKTLAKVIEQVDKHIDTKKPFNHTYGIDATTF
jgi:hypothetical protein